MISTNELHHYTSRKENLCGILKNGFCPSFCRETFLNGNDYWIPMVCFNDIPLEFAGKHKDWYGDYVIAMKPEWIMKNDIHPVHYIQLPTDENQHNLLAANNYLLHNYVDKIRPQIDEILSNMKPIETDDTTGRVIAGLIQANEFNEVMKEINSIFYPLTITMAFQKALRGKQFNRKLNKVIEKKFYDEREWRYFPSINDFNDYISGALFDFFLDLVVRGKYLAYHIDHSTIESLVGPNVSESLNGASFDKVLKYSLRFLPMDIEYIVMNNTDEKDFILEELPEFRSIEFKYWNDLKQ